MTIRYVWRSIHCTHSIDRVILETYSLSRTFDVFSPHLQSTPLDDAGTVRLTPAQLKDNQEKLQKLCSKACNAFLLLKKYIFTMYMKNLNRTIVSAV
jgi:hypothetical protein